MFRIRRIIEDYECRLEPDERLAAFDRSIAEVPSRPRAEVEAELEHIVDARRKAGRKRT